MRSSQKCCSWGGRQDAVQRLTLNLRLPKLAALLLYTAGCIPKAWGVFVADRQVALRESSKV